jgi:hypothetical protein
MAKAFRCASGRNPGEQKISKVFNNRRFLMETAVFYYPEFMVPHPHI